MNKDTKALLFDQFIGLISSYTKEEKQSMPKMIGILNKRVAQLGFKPLEIGTPVFEFQDRYFLYFETLDGKRTVEVSYYKEPHPGYEKWGIKPLIDFTSK